MTKESRKKTRVQFELAEESMARLQALKEVTEASSYADVTKNAYKLYERLIQYSEEGYIFLLKKGDETRQLELFI